MTRMFTGHGCCMDDGPCHDCGYCGDEDAPDAVSAADADADRGDAERARERDENMYLSVLADAEGSGR